MVWRQQGPKAWKLNPSKRPRSGPPVEGAGVGPIRRTSNGREDTPLPSKNRSGVNKPESKTSPPGRGEPPPCTGTVQVEAGVRPVGPEIEIGAPGGGARRALLQDWRAPSAVAPRPPILQKSLGRQRSTARRR